MTLGLHITNDGLHIKFDMRICRSAKLIEFWNRLGARRTCRFLRVSPAKISYKWAPLGVCKEENAQKLRFFCISFIEKG